MDLFSNEIISRLTDEILEHLKTIDQLKSENETLFKAIEEVNKINKRLETENEKLKDLNTRLDNQRETYWKGYQKLEQALKEIKEIAENDCYDDCGMPLDELSIILQKISEVIDDKAD